MGGEAKLEAAGLSGMLADSQMICQMINEGLILSNRLMYQKFVLGNVLFE